MPTETDTALLAQVIQFAIAPVFLLTGVGALLGVMANRLARIIDRARYVEGRWSEMSTAERKDARFELKSLARRARLSSWAINFCTFAVLLVCMLIATLFFDAFMQWKLRWLVGVLFIATMFALIAGMMCFLREVYVATHTMSIGPPEERPPASA